MNTALHAALLPLEDIGALDELAAELFTLDVVHTMTAASNPLLLRTAFGGR